MEVKCECGAVYERVTHRSPFKDKDDFKCDVCGRLMDSWNSTTYPEYWLVSSPLAKPKS